jgi:hypothetical protein
MRRPAGSATINATGTISAVVAKSDGRFVIIVI